jgi:hypothetical protein
MASVTSWDEHGNPIQSAAPTAWDEHGNPITAPQQTVAPTGNSFTGDTSGFKPADDGGGFLQHVWNNINPANMVSSVGKMLQRPVKTYLDDEQQRAADLKTAGSRASKLVHSDLPIDMKGVGLLDTAVQAAGDFVPFVGTAANHAADEVGQGNVRAGLGDATGLGIALAAPSIIKAAPAFAGAGADALAGTASRVGKVASKVKGALTVAPDVRAMAEGRVGPNINPSDADILAGGNGGNTSVAIDRQTAGASPTVQDYNLAEGRVPAPVNPADQSLAEGNAGDHTGVSMDQRIAEAQPHPDDLALVSRKAQQIQATHLPELTQRVGSIIDNAARQIPDGAVDTSKITGLSDKAEVAGESYKTAGQRVYAKLDEIAQQVTGRDWAFQKLAGDVNKLQEIVDDPATTPADKTSYQTQLSEAKARLDSFTQAAEQAGIPHIKAAIAQGNKLYSTGLSIQEFGRGVARNETIAQGPGGAITRVLKPNALPLDGAIRQVTDPVRPRGHVLAQAFGPENAVEIQKAAYDAAQKIAKDRAAQDAARARITATKQAAQAAAQRVADAQRAAKANVADVMRQHQAAQTAAANRVRSIQSQGNAAVQRLSKAETAAQRNIDTATRENDIARQVAQNRVKVVRNRQGAIIGGTAALVGAKVLASKGVDAYHALKNEK